MNISDIRSQTIDQVRSNLLSLQEDFAKISCRLNTTDAKMQQKLREIRKDIARVYTVLEEKRRG